MIVVVCNVSAVIRFFCTVSYQDGCLEDTEDGTEPLHLRAHYATTVSVTTRIADLVFSKEEVESEEIYRRSFYHRYARSHKGVLVKHL